MAKKIDLNRTVFELTQEYPELIDILAGLGFTEITKKPMLHSAGKIMTIPKGAKIKKIPMIKVVKALLDNGFILAGEMPEEKKAGTAIHSQPTALSDERTEQLKKYLRRLGDGENLEAVRADFVREFRQVDAAEIMNAEQELMKEGTPLSEVQKLCDIHSALFHGATREEQIANAEKAVEESLRKQKEDTEFSGLRSSSETDYGNKKARAAALELISGHPLQTLTKENQALSELLEKFKQSRDLSLFPAIRELSIHYAKKAIFFTHF